MAVSILVVGAGVALSSSLGILGYNGTTGLQMTPKADWNEFHRTYFEGANPIYSFDDRKKQPDVTSDNMVEFDKRLVNLLTYLAKKPANVSTCPSWPKGATQTPDKIGLSIVSPAGVDSDLYTPADNISSVSTIYRGVGLRITGRDKFKCTAYYQNPSTRFCDNMLQKKADEFDILFADDGSLDHSPDPTKLAEVCKIECAVNYYPDKPFNATDEESHARDKNNLERSKMPWGNLMPDSDNILYLEVPNYAKAAASYKMIETVYQILDIDKNGCYSNETMKKLGRDISCDADGKNCSAKMPFTIVLPNWVANEIKNKNTPAEVSGTSTSIWKDLEKTAKANYLIDLQSVNRSPLAGISWDPDKVDSQGNLINWNSTLENLHVNY